jgi:hypothetical protein
MMIGGMPFAANNFILSVLHFDPIFALLRQTFGGVYFDVGPMSSELVILPPRKHSLRPRYLEENGLGET